MGDRVHKEWDRLNYGEYKYFQENLFEIWFTKEQLDNLLRQTWQKAQIHFKDKRKFLSSKLPRFFCYDTEEWGKRPFCTMGLRTNESRQLEVFGNLTQNISFTRIKDGFLSDIAESQVITPKFDPNAIPIIWGANKRELQMLENRGIEKYWEVQNLVKKVLNRDQAINLKAAEELIIPWFQRQSCEFWKHKDDWIMCDYKVRHSVGDQMFWSLARLAQGLPIQNCEICGKPQDVLLYCLEDALSPLFLIDAIEPSIFTN